MARPLRISFEGALYHVTNRGNEKRDIFTDDTEKKVFLRLLKAAVKENQWRCYGYCLMNNHYHLLLETPLANISKGMKKINAEYSQYFNSKHRRVGHLFQGRFKAILVEKDSHLLELCRYIVLNPVRAGLCITPDKYEWSSYRATMNRSACPRLIERNWILSQFSESLAEKAARNLYQQFVKEGDIPSPWKRVISQTYFGSDDFVKKMTATFANLQNSATNEIR